MSRRKSPEGRRAGRAGGGFSPCRAGRSFLSSEPPEGIRGAIAQLGERYNGIVEVTGSIPVGSTNNEKGLAAIG